MNRSFPRWAPVVLATLWIVLPDTARAQRLRFSVGAPIEIGAGEPGPQAVALGDVNNDGRTDIVVVSIDEDGGPLAVLINQENGTFAAPRFVSDPETILTEPVAIALADVGAVSGGPDGNVDIIAVELDAGYLVAFGDGTGNFVIEGDISELEGLDSPVALAVADFDGEDGPDLAIVDEEAGDDNGEVFFLCNEGLAGLFLPCPTLALTTGGEVPIDMGAGDFNGDGRVDVVVLNQGGSAGDGRVALFTGNGDGTFTIPQQATFPVANEPRDLAVGSLNPIDDAIDDVAVAEFEVLSDDNVTILLGGTGGAIFTRPAKALLEIGTTALAVGNFGTDTNPDLLGGNDPDQATSIITVANGDGTGAFQAPQQGGTIGGGALSLVAGRFNDDDLDDFVVLNQDATELRIALNTSTSGTETPGTPMPGSPTLTPTPTPTRAVTASLERCDVDFSTDTLGTVRPVAMGQGRFDGDTIPDLAVVDAAARRVLVVLTDPNLLNDRTKDCRITAPRTFQVGNNPVAIAVGLVNDDNRPDLAVATADGISILLAAGEPGQFIALAPVVVGSDPRSVALADFNLDGAMDLAVANRASNNAMILYGSGGETPTFGPPTIFENIQSPVIVVAAMLDSNGWPDLAIASSNNTVTIRRQVSEDTFPTTGVGQTRVVSLTTGTPTAMIAAALDGGSLQQLLVTTTSPVNATGNLVVVRQNGDNFSVGPPLSTGGGPSAIGLGNFVPSAGGNDVVVANVESQAWFFPDNANGTFSNATSMPRLGGLPRAIGVGDFDGDGEVDVITANETGFDLTFLLSSRVAPTPTPTSTSTPGPSSTPTNPQTPDPTSTPVPPTPDGTSTPKEGTFELSSCSIAAPSQEPISSFTWLGLGAVGLILARRRSRADGRRRGDIQ